MNLNFWLKRLLGKATCELGVGTKLSSSARIHNIRNEIGYIQIGSHSLIAGELLVFAHGGHISIGEWCFVGEGARIWSSASIQIGDRVLISHNVNVFDSLTHPLKAQQRHQHFKAITQTGHPREIKLDEHPVTICDDAWIGANTSVLRGVTIGKGAIIGTGSIVTHDIPAFTIAAGNPARIIRELNTDER